MNPLVYIVILNWNKNEQTLECIRSVMNSDYDNFRIVIVDNGPIVKLEDCLIREFPEASYIFNSENLGFTGGCNQGIELALKNGADYIWLLNNDTEVPRSCLSNMVKEAIVSPEIGLLSPVILTADEPQRAYYGSYVDIAKGQLSDADEISTYQKWLEKEPEKIWLWGTAVLINAKLVEKVGMLDDDFFAYYEDNEYSLRSTKAGFTNRVCLDALIIHQVSPINNPQNKSYYYFLFARNHYLFWIKTGLSHKVARKRTFHHFFPIINYNYKKGAIALSKAYISGLWHAVNLRRFGIVPQTIDPPKIVILTYLFLTEVYIFFFRLNKRVKNRIRLIETGLAKRPSIF